VNFDMLSKNAKGELYASGAHHFPCLKARLEQLAAEVPVTLKQGHDGPPWTGQGDWTTQSDHFAFHEKGVPWVYFGVEDHPEYHQPTDDAATIPAAFFDRAVETVTKAVRMFDEDLDAIARDGGRGRP
jgi:Zn-dependent M28 family amino/carboxypeptidase